MKISIGLEVKLQIQFVKGISIAGIVKLLLASSIYSYLFDSMLPCADLGGGGGGGGGPEPMPA